MFSRQLWRPLLGTGVECLRDSSERTDAISSPPDSPYSFQHPYVSAHNRARIVSVLLIVSAVASFASLPLSILPIFFPSMAGDEELNDPAALVVALLQVSLGLIQIVVYLATIVAFPMWLYRSYENLPSFGVRRNNIKYSSGWAVGSFFIPLVSLVVPYRAVKELWIKSVPNSAEMFADLSPPGFFPLWWGLWLVSNFANQIYLRLSWREGLTPQVDATLGVITGILDILACVLALMVVREIDRQQTDSAKLIPSKSKSPYPPPPPLYAA
jgi:hypothetical protein